MKFLNCKQPAFENVKFLWWLAGVKNKLEFKGLKATKQMALITKFLIWDDIDFDHDFIRVKPGRIKEIVKPISFKGSMPSLNAIKTEYFVKHYSRPFKLVFIDSELSKVHSPAWKEINELIEKAIEVHRYAKLPKINKVPKQKPLGNKNGGVEAIKENKEKPDYLKFLASLQSGYKLITIKEKYEGRVEESHIYRFTTLTGRILIVWENTNASRAAYLFIADETTMAERLSKIEAFINTENILFKRSRFRKLKENKELRSEMCFIGSVKHESISQFSTNIKTYINRY
jgi:hypothetical protein